MSARRASGMSLPVVLVLLVVLLLGGMSMARVAADAGLVAGNSAWRDAALQASEVGLADGFEAVRALVDDGADQPDAGYFATRRAEDAAGLPGGVDWSAMPATTVGPYTVQRLIERLCTGPLPVVDPARQCVLRPTASAPEGSSKAGADAFEVASGRQYRVTVHVIGPKRTEVFVQDAVTR